MAALEELEVKVTKYLMREPWMSETGWRAIANI